MNALNHFLLSEGSMFEIKYDDENAESAAGGRIPANSLGYVAYYDVSTPASIHINYCTIAVKVIITRKGAVGWERLETRYLQHRIVPRKLLVKISPKTFLHRNTHNFIKYRLEPYHFSKSNIREFDTLNFIAWALSKILFLQHVKAEILKVEENLKGTDLVFPQQLMILSPLCNEVTEAALKYGTHRKTPQVLIDRFTTKRREDIAYELAWHESELAIGILYYYTQIQSRIFRQFGNLMEHHSVPIKAETETVSYDKANMLHDYAYRELCKLTLLTHERTAPKHFVIK